MSTTNNAILYDIGLEAQLHPIGAAVAGTASSQGSATPLMTAVTRITGAPANGSLLLRSIQSEEAPPIALVVNDSGQTVKVYCSAGENMNGVANSFLSIPTGQSGIFFQVPNAAGGTLDWRSAVIA